MTDLTPETFMDHIQSDPALVLFHREWSAESRQMLALLESLNVHFGRLNIEQHLDFCDGLGVYNAPQVLFYRRGLLHFRLSGLQPVQSVLHRWDLLQTR